MKRYLSSIAVTLLGIWLSTNANAQQERPQHSLILFTDQHGSTMYSVNGGKSWEPFVSKSEGNGKIHLTKMYAVLRNTLWISTNNGRSWVKSDRSTPEVHVELNPQSIDASTVSDASPHIEVYPNPASESVSIRVADREPVTVSIVNSAGEAVQQSFVHAPSGDGTISVDLTALAPGSYYVQVRWESCPQCRAHIAFVKTK